MCEIIFFPAKHVAIKKYTTKYLSDISDLWEIREREGSMEVESLSHPVLGVI